MEVPHLLHEDWRPAPPPIREPACLFVVLLVEEGLKHRTIKGCLSARQRMQIVWGAGDPFKVSWPRQESTLQGVKLKQAKTWGTLPRERLPITPAILRLVKGAWETEGGETGQHHAVGGVLHLPLWFSMAGEAMASRPWNPP